MKSQKQLGCSCRIQYVGNDLVSSKESQKMVNTDQSAEINKRKANINFQRPSKRQYVPEPLTPPPYAMNSYGYGSPSPSAFTTTTWGRNTGRPLGPCFQCGQVGHIRVLPSQSSLSFNIIVQRMRVVLII